MAVLTWGLWALEWRARAAVFAILTVTSAAFVIRFFRDPERSISIAENEIVSAADGIVDSVEVVEEPSLLKAQAVRISVRTRLVDIHTHRSPLSGLVRVVRHTSGFTVFSTVRRSPEAEQRLDLLLEGPRVSCLFRHAPGLLVHRAFPNLRPGEIVRKGEPVGYANVGSRIDLFVPASGIDVAVKKGDVVQAGLTVIARLRT